MATQTIFLKHDDETGGTEIGQYLGGNSISWFTGGSLGTHYWNDSENKFVSDCQGTVDWGKGDLEVQTFTHQGHPFLWRFSKSVGSSQIGKYEGDGNILWYDKTYFKANFYTHALTFNHGFDGHVFLHNRNSGYTQIGVYVSGRKFSWYKGSTWAKEWTDQICFIQNKGVATLLQYNKASGEVSVGVYEGAPNGQPKFKWFDPWKWAPNYGTHLIPFENNGSAYFLKHDLPSGGTYVAKYEGNGKVTWYDNLQWAKQFSTHLMMFNSVGETYILQHNANTGYVQIGHYQGENNFKWFHSSTWAAKYCTNIISFQCQPMISEHRKIGEQYLVCSSPIVSLKEENHMELLDKMNDENPSVRICFDWPGSSNKVDSEQEAKTWKKVEEAKQKSKDELRDAVTATLWFRLFAGQVKGSIKTAAQSGADVKVICLRGGPISQVELEEMPTIVDKTKEDVKKFHVHPSINLCVYDTIDDFKAAVAKHSSASSN
eukprot:TRINITY_DN2337_c0_g1_i1.p1 TRINITY_DN2337_c0_g1~~TRINITY_DN2337_c0_g1_i1.p1  ORF type:complete len:487 (-),score=59.51 TRINITY_DN2337_c0_g1_i1:128-1588(-)